MLDFNHASGLVYGHGSERQTLSHQINGIIDKALEQDNHSQPPRDYLGASRIGEPCARRLGYDYAKVPKDPGADFDGALLRIFQAGHVFEDLSIDWLTKAGFTLKTRTRAGTQIGFETAGGRIRGHVDGIIVDGPNLGFAWPALWEHKALNERSRQDLVRRGLAVSKPVYFTQVQLYMAYLGLEQCLFTALNKNTCGLHHEVARFDAAAAQEASDKAARIVHTVDAGDLPPRIAAARDHYVCRTCPFAHRCWEGMA